MLSMALVSGVFVFVYIKVIGNFLSNCYRRIYRTLVSIDIQITCFHWYILCGCNLTRSGWMTLYTVQCMSRILPTWGCGLAHKVMHTQSCE